MNNRTLGTLGMAGAPFLLLLTISPSYLGEWKQPSYDGIFGMVYLTAWMCSIAGLYRTEALGRGRWGRGLLLFTLFTLALANLLSLTEAVAPKADPLLLKVLDAFWPLSSLTMLVVGVTAAVQGRLPGWQRYVPLAAGLWLPLAFGAIIVLDWAPAAELLAGLYAAAAWMALGYVVRTSESKESFIPARGLLLSRG